MTKKPWDISPALTLDRLTAVASFIRQVRDETIDLHDSAGGDTARSTGLRAYERCRSKLNEVATDPEMWSWFGVIKSDQKFTFSIGGVPVRLYRGDPNCPEERRLIPCVEAVSQMSLLFEDVGEASSIMWFFAIEVDDDRYVEKVWFTGYQQDGVQICCMEVPLDASVPVMTAVDDELPQPVVKGKAKVGVRRKDKKAENDK